MKTTIHTTAILTGIALLSGCMTYVRTANISDSRVDIAAIRTAMALQVGVQTRGQHIPDGDQRTDQEGGGRADTALDLPVNITKPVTTTTSAAAAEAVAAAGQTTPAVTVVPVTTNATATTENGTPIIWDRGGSDANGSGAVRDTNVTISAVSADQSRITWTQPDITHWSYHDGATWSWTIMGRKDSAGVYHVGKYDWGRGGAGAQAKDTTNIRGGYKGHTMYSPGETILIGIVDTKGKWRSNWVEVVSK